MFTEQDHKNFDFYQLKFAIATLLEPDGTAPLKICAGIDYHCRFCNKTKPTAKFKKKAHAFPELIGNKRFYTLYECDRCNQSFGDGIETQLGNWSHVYRTLTQIPSKDGIPKLDPKGKDWKILVDDEGLKVHTTQENPVFEFDKEKNKLKFEIEIPTYTPLAVLKTFYKMALCVMPEDEIHDFQEIISWVKDASHDYFAAGISTSVFLTSLPGPRPFPRIFCVLAKRLENDSSLPHMTFVIGFGNFIYQIFLAGKSNLNSNFTMPYFPPPCGSFTEFGPVQRQVLDLSGTEPVRNKTEKMNFSCEEFRLVTKEN